MTSLYEIGHFLTFEKYTVLIDETDNYISFINDRLFNELNTLMKSIDGKPVKLRDVIQLINKSKKMSSQKIFEL